MRRALPAEHDTALAIARTVGLAAHEPGHLPAQLLDLAILPGDDLGQVVHRAHEVGQAFLDLAHGLRICRPCAPVNLAPARPLG